MEMDFVVHLKFTDDAASNKKMTTKDVYADDFTK